MKDTKSKWIIAILSFVFFIVVWNKNQWFDSYAFVVDAREGVDIVHPHHLFYNLFRYLLYHFSSFIGIDQFRFLSGVSSVFGAASLALVYSIIKKATSDSFKSLIGVLAIAGLFGFWFYSSSVEVNITSVFFLLLAINSISGGKHNRKQTAVTFLWLTIGVLFHQILGMAVIVFLLYEMYRYGSVTEPLKPASISLIPGFIIYSVVGFFYAETKSIPGLLKWFTAYAHYGRWGILSLDNFANSASGTIKAIFGGTSLRTILFVDEITFSGYLYLFLISLILLGMLLLTIFSIRSYFRKEDKTNLLIILLFVVFLIFAFWWAPNDDGFWLYPLILAVMFVISNLNMNKITKPVTVTIVVMLLGLNLFCEIIPNSRDKNSIASSSSTALSKLNFAESDLIITNMLHLALAHNYYSGVKVKFGSIALQESGTFEEMASALRDKINECEGRIFIFENEMKPEPHRRFLYDLISAEQYDQFYNQLRPDLIVRDSVLIYAKFVKIYELNRNQPDESNPETSLNQ